MAIEIRAFEPRFQDEVGELISTIQREEFGVSISLDAQPDLQAISSFYQTAAGNFWVARANDAVVGTIALKDIGNNQVALRKMFVAANYRGSSYGVSRLLLDAALQWAISKGVTGIYLGTTEKFLAAHRFYEKNGFQQVSKSELPETFPLMTVDTRFYLRKL